MNKNESGIPSDRYAMIIGSMKSGTTSLFDYLSEHPDICPATVKEPEYFSQKQGHKLVLKDYDSLWPDFNIDQHRYALEASTGYTKFPYEEGVAERISHAGLRPKFIYIVRDPIERIKSNIRFKDMSTGALKVEESQPAYTSRYFLQLQQFEVLFGHDSLLVLDFDDLCLDPKKVLDRVCSFLGISAYETMPDLTARNVTLNTREKKIKSLLIKTGMISLWSAIPPTVRLSARRLVRTLFPSKKSHYELSEEQVNTLRNALRSDIEKLGPAYNIDISKWGF